jgi:mono/diheme cytochrome c family protein
MGDDRADVSGGEVTRTGPVAIALVAVAAVAATFLTGCPGAETHADGLVTSTLPANMVADYEVFAQRCSKCHALSRALDSGISDDTFWREYVARMRRQPASGISPGDEAPILRFLHYYSVDQLRKRAAASAGDGG